VLVVPASALVRRVVPRAIVERHTELVRAEEELDRDSLLARLTESGYLRVPVVEDPGTFAVRGALLDVWAPSSPRPVRIELYGELVLSIKTFDPEGQRTIAPVSSLRLPPAREAVLTKEATDRAKLRTMERCEAVDLPTSKARALVEDVAQGRSFFGAEGYLPAYYEQLDPLWRYLPKGALVAIDDPSAVVSTLREELARAQRDETAKNGAPVFPASAHYLTEADVAAELSGAQLLVLHRVQLASAGAASDDESSALQPLEGTPDDTPTLAAHDQSELAIAIRQARSTRGRRGALDPLVRRLRVWREQGLRTMVTARATTQAERLVSLLRAHDVTTKARLNHFDARWLRDETFGRDVVEVCVGSLAEGTILRGERLAIVTEEEIFGARAKRRAPRAQTAKDAARPFIEDLRALNVGDLVVHAEHGIGRYLGLEHREILGPAIVDADGKLHQPKTKVDLIVVEYGGSDRLYLPVYRLNQIQKYSGGEGAAEKARLDKLGGSTFAKAKSRVEKAVRQMADELLRLYAERQAVEGEPLPTRHEGDDYREFEATFPFEETTDQAKAIEDVLDDLEKSRPMDRLVCGDVGFGKTEVAIRAAFRAAMTGKQVAVLCPTTVLAQQ
ncbi:MAG: CarD family transcriptional regulator, partial [Polyangiales bacterium]